MLPLPQSKIRTYNFWLYSRRFASWDSTKHRWKPSFSSGLRICCCETTVRKPQLGTRENLLHLGLVELADGNPQIPRTDRVENSPLIRGPHNSSLCCSRATWICEYQRKVFGRCSLHSHCDRDSCMCSLASFCSWARSLSTSPSLSVGPRYWVLVSRRWVVTTYTLLLGT